MAVIILMSYYNSAILSFKLASITINLSNDEIALKLFKKFVESAKE